MLWRTQKPRLPSVFRARSAACGGSDGTDFSRRAPGRWRRHFKIYLRRAADLEAARLALRGTLLRDGDAATWLRADICRAASLVEIEATLIGTQPAAERR